MVREDNLPVGLCRPARHGFVHSLERTSESVCMSRRARRWYSIHAAIGFLSLSSQVVNMLMSWSKSDAMSLAALQERREGVPACHPPYRFASRRVTFALPGRLHLGRTQRAHWGP